MASHERKENNQLARVKEIYDREARFYDVSRRMILTHRKRAIDLMSSIENPNDSGKIVWIWKKVI